VGTKPQQRVLVSREGREVQYLSTLRRPQYSISTYHLKQGSTDPSLPTAFSIDHFEIAGRDNSGASYSKTETNKKSKKSITPPPIPHMQAFDPVKCTAQHGMQRSPRWRLVSFCLGAILDMITCTPLHGEMSAFEPCRKNLLSVDIVI
jgi:hypothetical protein